jgi:hypothetical protein
MITTAESYSDHRNAMAERRRNQSRAGRDIGRIPGIDDGHPLPPESKNRRDLAGPSLRQHCEIYAAAKFSLGWSPDHLHVIEKMETAILDGGLFAVAMPRGSGKTTLAEEAVTWALINGHRRFVQFIGSTADAAKNLLANILTTLETSDLLLDDYPEICKPLEALEGIRQRRLLHNGQLIRMEFTQDRISLPWIEGSAAAGGTVRAAGLTGSFRGAIVQLPDGTRLRPDLVIVDDPQTYESAKSPSQVQKRERILAGDVMGLAGPGKQISGVMPCTVIQEGDLADRFLDPQIHPEWNGHRTQMLTSWPDRMDLWEIYQEKLADGLREQGTAEAAQEYYAENREAMDAGAVASWPERKLPGELSAIQHAMNLWIRDAEAFAAEYQNKPIRASLGDEVPLLTAAEIVQKTNGLKRGHVMDGCTAVTAFVDVQDACLWWAVSAWKPDFTGHLVDWGAFPDQGRNYYTMQDIRKTLKRAKQGVGLEAALTWALGELADLLFGRTYEREDGEPLDLDLMLIDANYQTQTVRDWIRRQKRGKLISPDHGRYYGASAQPLGERKRKKGEVIGEEWRTSRIKRQLHILHDSNYWKSFLQERLAVPMGDPGCYSLPSCRQNTLQMVADHLTAEYRVRVTAERGSRRVVDEWKLPPGKPDNHLLDCITGTAVAASICRCKLQHKASTTKTASPEPQDGATETKPKKPAANGGRGKKRKRRRWRMG